MSWAVLHGDRGGVTGKFAALIAPLTLRAPDSPSLTFRQVFRTSCCAVRPVWTAAANSSSRYLEQAGPKKVHLVRSISERTLQMTLQC